MKKYFIILLSLVLIIAFLPGCSSADKTPAPDSDKTQAESKEPPTDNNSQKNAEADLDKALSALATPGWPEGKISDKIPKYPYGEVKNSGDFGDGEYVILISPTNKDEYQEYLSLLEGQGFTLSDGDRARIGTLSLRFQFNTSDTLQVIVSDLGSGKWPTLPGDVLPPDKGTIMGEVDILNISADDKSQGHYYYAGFTLVDVTEEDCQAFVQKQVANGWEDAGGGMATKEVTFDGVTCDLMFQFVQFYDGQGDFTLEAWKK